MQEIYIKDPFGDGRTYHIDDSVPKEVLDELVKVMDENTRKIQNLERKEHKHCYSLDAIVYEGLDYADPASLSDPCVEEDPDKQMEIYLSVLTETQRRRCMMRLSGMSLHQIAEAEGKDYSTINESVTAIGKRLHKHFPKIFPEKI